MKLKTQLYVDTSLDGSVEDYRLIEFFDFESIEITETIKNVKDIGVVFSDYTKDFVVPASKNNNKIFKHYYSTKIIDGFDARIKKKARIFVNGVFFKQGYIRLASANIKDGYPYSYSLNFFGSLSGISDVIGGDKLSDLKYLERYNHEFSRTNAFNGLKSGLQYNGSSMEEYTNKTRDITYPLISAQNSWYYKSTAVEPDIDFKEGKAENLYNNVGGSPNPSYGLNHQHLKPAIKVSNIFKAISENYESINIKEDCFVYGAKLDELYMLMHPKKGVFSQGVEGAPTEKKLFLVDYNFILSGGDEELYPINTYTRYESGGFNIQQARNKTNIKFNVEIVTPPSPSDIEYELKIFSGNTLLTSKVSTAHLDNINYDLETINYKTWNDLRFEISANGSVSSYKVSMTISENYATRSYSASISDTPFPAGNTKTSDYPSVNLSGVDPTYNFTQQVDVLQQLPDMKVIDFMSGIFKMFNLVAEVDDATGEIDIKTINTFYGQGSERDITSYVDSYNYEVERLQLYGDISFKYEEPTTFGLLNHNEVTQDTFGDLLYSNTDDGGNDNLVFDKGTYNIDLPFEKLYFSKLTDEDDDSLTDICTGWLVGEDQDPVITKPILFFNVNTSINTANYKFGVKGESTFLSSYNRGSNSNSSGTLTLNFNKEKDEFTLAPNENSLFKSFYKDYIINTFSQESRNLKIGGRLPLSFLINYSLSDKLLINGDKFIVNEITTNLNTGKSQLDLVTAFNITQESIGGGGLADVTGVSVDETSFGGVISWNANTEDDLAGYKVYISTDNITFTLSKSLGLTTTTEINDLEENTSYYVKVTAVNDANVETLLADATSVAFTTLVFTDVQAPTIPQNLRVITIDSTSVSVAWDASTDNVSVTGYIVHLDGLGLLPDATNTEYTITGLTPGTFYDISVLAYDGENNYSNLSTPITIVTDS